MPKYQLEGAYITNFDVNGSGDKAPRDNFEFKSMPKGSGDKYANQEVSYALSREDDSDGHIDTQKDHILFFDEADAAVPTEDVTFHYETIDWTY